MPDADDDASGCVSAVGFEVELLDRVAVARDTSINIWYHPVVATNTSISLDEHFATFLSAQVHGGRYGSASEVVRAGLRLLEEREAQLSALQAALTSGETSGEAEPFDFDAFIASKTS